MSEKYYLPSHLAPIHAAALAVPEPDRTDADKLRAHLARLVPDVEDDLLGGFGAFHGTFEVAAARTVYANADAPSLARYILECKLEPIDDVMAVIQRALLP